MEWQTVGLHCPDLSVWKLMIIKVHVDLMENLTWVLMYVLLNLVNELWEKIRCEAVLSILSIFPYEFNKFNNTRAQCKILFNIWHYITFNAGFSLQNIKISPLQNPTFWLASMHNDDNVVNASR